jgi:hypothetical protein
VNSARAVWRSGGLLLLFAALASAQASFQLQVSQQGNVFGVSNGSTLQFSTAVGQSEPATLTVTYRGLGQVLINQPPQLPSGTAFALNFSTKLPLTLDPGNSFSVSLVFQPVSTTQSTSELTILYAETVLNGGTLANPTYTTTPGTINLTLQGTTPSFVLSYLLPADQNVVPLPAGGTITFPPTPLSATTDATLNITNRGSGSGAIQNISLTGAAFRLIGLPLFPDAVASGQNLQVTIRYQPTATGTDMGQVQITFDSGSVTILLQGSSSTAAFAYQVLQTSGAVGVAPGSSIAFPDTNVGETSSLTLRVQNNGIAPGTIGSASLSGAGFALSAGPSFPVTLAPNASFTLTLAFTPTQPGSASGQLTIGSDTFNTTGQGLGSKLVFSYLSGGSAITLPSGGSVVFSPVQISQTAKLSFIVKNTGTLSANLSNIGIGEAKSPFSVSDLPPLPTSVAPNTSLMFTLSYTPTSTGFSNGTLILDTTTIGLIASGTAPPPLPTYSIQGPGAQAGAASQPSVSLKLSTPYPIAINGILTLSISTNLTDDPAVQFVTGGRTVPFAIPANATDAVFASQGTQIRLQTGTVANTIILTPSFATQVGGMDLTPANPATLQFAVAAAPPVIQATQIVTGTATSFTINVVGYSTTRSLTALNVQFTPATGFAITTSTFTINLQQPSTIWYQSSASQPFGGQFEVAVPFNFQGTVPAGQSVLNSFTSLSVSVSNESGTSNVVQGAQ